MAMDDKPLSFVRRAELLRMGRRQWQKNIVICIEGTGNEFGNTNSNVVKLFSTLKLDDSGQIAYYHPGLGIMGAPNFNIATSANGQHTITKASPSISLTPSPASPQPVNTSVTVTAALGGAVFTPIAPGGTVAFSVGSSPIPGCTAVSVTASQQATCITSSLALGSNSITAIYSGDSNFNIVTSAALPYTISKTSPTISVVPSPARPQPVNTSVTFTATLAGASFTPFVPGGTAVFWVNGTPITGCTAVPVNAAQQATCTTAPFVLSLSLSLCCANQTGYL